MRKRNRHILHSAFTDVSLIHPLEIDEYLQGLAEEDKEYLDWFLENRTTLEDLAKNNDRTLLFYALWKIEYHDKGENPRDVGYLYFHGPAQLGVLELTIYIKKEYRNKGIGTTSLKMISEWGFFQKDIYEIKSYFGDLNDGAIHSYTKAGFIYRGVTDHVETYSITKEPSYWRGLYLMHGLWIGCLLSIVVGSFYVGLPIGIVAGLALGSYLERKENLHRAAVTGTTLKRRFSLSFKRKRKSEPEA